MCGEPPRQLWQNKRCPRFFSNDGGKTWYDVDKKTVRAVQEGVAHGGFNMDSGYFGYWRRPDGHLIDVPGDVPHDEVIYGIKEFSGADNPSDAYDKAIDNGWVAINGKLKEGELKELGFYAGDSGSGFAAMRDLMPKIMRCDRVFTDMPDGNSKYFDNIKISQEQRALLRKYVEEGLGKYADNANESSIASRMWSLWAETFYENLLGPVKDLRELGKTYRNKLKELLKDGARGEMIYALKYFYDFRKKEIDSGESDGVQIDEERIVDYSGGKEVQRWFTLTQEKWQWFYDMVYKQLAHDNQYAKDVLETIKNKKLRCSQRQYDYLKSVVSGEASPSLYGPKN
jgi:hypothetical protein